MTKRSKPERSSQPAKPPLKWTGIVFAFAANMLLTTAGDMLATRLPLGINAELLATIVAPILAGILTAFYVKQRGGIHAFLGGMLSIPLLAVSVFAGNWQLAILSGSFCTIGGALSEIAMRGRAK